MGIFEMPQAILTHRPSVEEEGLAQWLPVPAAGEAPWDVNGIQGNSLRLSLQVEGTWAWIYVI